MNVWIVIAGFVLAKIHFITRDDWLSSRIHLTNLLSYHCYFYFSLFSHPLQLTVIMDLFFTVTLAESERKKKGTDCFSGASYECVFAQILVVGHVLRFDCNIVWNLVYEIKELCVLGACECVCVCSPVNYTMEKRRYSYFVAFNRINKQEALDISCTISNWTHSQWCDAK